MLTEPMIKKSTHDLALLIASNVCAAQLPDNVARHYLENKEEVVSAIIRGFVLPGVNQVTENLAPQDLNWWLKKTEEFAKNHLGIEVNLRERFAIPAELPWQSAIPVFDPGKLENRNMVEKALKRQGLAVWEETDVIKYAGSEAGEAPTLHFIENSERPNEDTMNMSPDQLRDTKKSYLRLRGYGLAFAVYHFATRKHLDPETFTWFPEDRLPGGWVARGFWGPASREVLFDWDDPDDRRACCGARVAIPVSLKP